MKQKLKKLIVFKSPGPDGLHPRLLKEAAGVVPDEWKDANVTALIKKGNRHSALN